MLLIQKYLEQRQSHFIKSPTLIQTLGSAFEISLLLLLWWLMVNAMQFDDAQTIFVIFSQKALFLAQSSSFDGVFFYFCRFIFPISAGSFFSFLSVRFFPFLPDRWNMFSFLSVSFFPILISLDHFNAICKKDERIAMKMQSVALIWFGHLILWNCRLQSRQIIIFLDGVGELSHMPLFERFNFCLNCN